ncbi:MAG: hypothetical protein AAF598_20085, partial [Bacteroidota bacterium]
MSSRILFWFLALSVIGIGCTPSEDEIVIQDTAFFDLGTYFEKESSKWKGLSIEKTVKLNEQQERQSLSDL